MWSTESLWFDLAIVMSIFAFGNVLFGRFEDHKPRGRRVLKVTTVAAVVLVLSATAGRIWSFGLVGGMLLAAAWVHIYWLPKHGINGWTAEPREKYLALVTRKGR
jgi:hypothetical protein